MRRRQWNSQNAFRNYSALALPAQSIHPGLKIFEDIEKRWRIRPGEKKIRAHGREGKEKIFEVRTSENDVSFLHNYLTRELIEELDFIYIKIGYDWKITDKSGKSTR